MNSLLNPFSCRGIKSCLCACPAPCRAKYTPVAVDDDYFDSLAKAVYVRSGLSLGSYNHRRRSDWYSKGDAWLDLL